MLNHAEKEAHLAVRSSLTIHIVVVTIFFSGIIVLKKKGDFIEDFSYHKKLLSKLH